MERAAARRQRLFSNSNEWLVQDDALGEWATVTGLHIKLDRLTLDERLATLTLDLLSLIHI